jgi:hypothetical protein
MARKKRTRKTGARVEAKKPPLGSGERFAQVAAAARAHGAENPEAVAAAVGRRKYGAARMAELAAAGRRRALSADRQAYAAARRKMVRQ